MRSCLIIIIWALLFLMAGMAFGQEMIYPPTHQYFIHKDGQATLIEYKNWKIFSPGCDGGDDLFEGDDVTYLNEGRLKWN